MAQIRQIYYWMLKPWFFLLVSLLSISSYIYFDTKIALYFYHMDIGKQFPWFKIISLFGKWEIYTLLLLLLAVYMHIFHPKSLWRSRIWLLFFCVLIPNAVASFLKIILGRARPELYFESLKYGFYGLKFQRSYWSFPSGHTTTIIGLVSGLTVLFPRYVLLLFSIALVIVSSRVLLYQHYFSDVLFSTYLTVLEVGLIVYFLNKKGLLKIPR